MKPFHKWIWLKPSHLKFFLLWEIWWTKAKWGKEKWEGRRVKISEGKVKVQNTIKKLSNAKFTSLSYLLMLNWFSLYEIRVQKFIIRYDVKFLINQLKSINKNINNLRIIQNKSCEKSIDWDFYFKGYINYILCTIIITNIKIYILKGTQNINYNCT